MATEKKKENDKLIDMSEKEFKDLISPYEKPLEPIYNFEPGSKPSIVEGDNNNVGNYNHNEVIVKLINLICEKDKIIEKKDALIEKLIDKMK